jgi:undecaprenyl-diphosphatase
MIKRKHDKKKTHFLTTGLLLLLAFALWTLLIQIVDVRPAGETATDVGFATLNSRFHGLTGVHMTLYHITDWLGLVPVFVCLCFGVLGLCQWIRRKSLWKVDGDILLLGVYYVLAIFLYLAFEMIPINYRPILIAGFTEASYPSSTTLLVLMVMPTLVFQINRRGKNHRVKKATAALTMAFSACMVLGRTVAGVHWLTDILGSILLSGGMFHLYRAMVLKFDRQEAP